MFYVELDCVIKGSDYDALEGLLMATLKHNVMLAVIATNNVNHCEEIRVVASSRDSVISFLQWYNCDTEEMAVSYFDEYGGKL